MSRYSEGEIFEFFQWQVRGLLTYTAVVARRMGVGVSEIAALEHLEGAGELTPTGLGRRLSMSSGTVTPLVDRLERAGYVERRPNPEDRRSSVVRLTSEGRHAAAEQIGPLGLRLREIVGGLTAEERAAVGAYLEGVNTAIERYSSDEQT